MGKLKYRRGDSLLLAYPSDPAIAGFEIEVLSINDIVAKEYVVWVLATNEHMRVHEQQLAPLEDANQPISWEDTPPWLYRFRMDPQDD